MMVSSTLYCVEKHSRGISLCQESHQPSGMSRLYGLFQFPIFGLFVQTSNGQFCAIEKDDAIEDDVSGLDVGLIYGSSFSSHRT